MEHQHSAADAPTWKFKTRLHHCEIWEHNIHRTVVEAYPLEKYEPAHAKINRNKTHIVNSLGIVVDNRNNRPYLLIQRIPNRFSSVPTLNEPQTLKILYAVFKGLEELEEIYGIVGLNESCICFNGSGKVKIWVNPDLSSLHPILHLKEHCSNEAKILYNIRQVICLVEKKCFNTSFLKPLIKKLNQNKICGYRQAADEIRKIGEMLFVVVEEKSASSINSSYHQSNSYKGKIQNEKFTNSKKNGVGETDEMRTIRRQNIQVHCRKFSNHQGTTETNHRRYQSFVESQPFKKQPTHHPVPNLGLNLNKLAQSQAFQMLMPQIHKSAPLSPREGSKRSHTKNNSQLKQNGVKNKTPLFHKKQESKSIFYETVKEEVPKFDDSFSQNLKVDQKQILVSGDFQTFGILEDLSDSSNNKKKHKKSQNRWQSGDEANQIEADYDFDIGQMDMEIQKKLENRIKEEKKRTSIRASFQSNDQKMGQRQRAKLKTLPYDEEKENYQISQQAAFKREKSPNFSYIDQKYEQYIHKSGLGKKGTDTLGTPVARQRNQGGQGAVAYNYSKFSLHSNNSSAPVMAKSPKQSYRIPTDR